MGLQMFTICDVRVFRDFIESRMAKAGYRGIEPLVRKLHIGRPTLYRIFERPEDTHRSTRELIASALKFIDWADLMKAFEADDVMWGLRPSDNQMDPRPLSPHENARPVPMPKASVIFDLPLAAGQWQEIPQACHIDDPTVLASGRFCVRLTGESMEPSYHSGQIVEFQFVQHHDSPRIGLNYYVQRSDGCATFKKLLKIDGDVMTLRALNREKYPKDLTVSSSDVIHMAVAVGKMGPT